MKRNEEDINVMTEQMKEQMQLKAKEYREELIQKVVGPTAEQDVL